MYFPLNRFVLVCFIVLNSSDFDIRRRVIGEYVLLFCFHTVWLICLCVLSDDSASQRERLAEQLTRGLLECLVCCDRVRQHDPVWSCTNCYHVLHLKCIKKWAKSSKSGRQPVHKRHVVCDHEVCGILSS